MLMVYIEVLIIYYLQLLFYGKFLKYFKKIVAYV